MVRKYLKHQQNNAVISIFARNFGGSKEIEKSFKRKLMDKSHKMCEFFMHTTISFYREADIQSKKYSENFDQHIITVNFDFRLDQKNNFGKRSLSRKYFSHNWIRRWKWIHANLSYIV